MPMWTGGKGTIMPAHVHERESLEGSLRTLSCWLPCEPDTAAQARAATRSFLERRVDSEELEGTLLAVSELVTNAGKFGNGDPIWLSVLVSSDRLVVTVTSSGANGLAAKIVSGEAALGPGISPLDEGGRGLGIVLDLFDDIAVSCLGATVVRAAKQLGSAPHPCSPLRVGDGEFALVRR
jgi:anti-sigma regulatory factor (Ser/Thr protein kinase)